MPSKITFTNVVLLSFNRTAKGGVASLSSSLTESVRTALGWPEIPDCLTGATPEGDLAATVGELCPSDKNMGMHTLEIELTRVHKFKIVRLELEGKKDKGHRLELRFNAEFSDTKGAQKLERYMLTIGEGKGRFVVSYTKQEVLPGMEGDAEEADPTKQPDLPGAIASRAEVEGPAKKPGPPKAK